MVGRTPAGHAPKREKAPLFPREGQEVPRNSGTRLDLDFIRNAGVDKAAVERGAKALGAGRLVSGSGLKEGLVKAISCMDLTDLSEDSTPGRIRNLCAKARRPIRKEVMEALGISHMDLTTAAVCVRPAMVETAVEALGNSGIPVAAVAGGFPRGLPSLKARRADITACVAAGATEIDIVITRGHVHLGNWEALFDEVAALREACGRAYLKAILATGDLETLTNVQKASFVCMMAGADFLKTSTGKETVNATLPAGLVMARAIRSFAGETGNQVGLKPAGGIGKAEQALGWLALVEEELGDPWLQPRLFRIGASSLLDDIQVKLEQTGARQKD